MNIQKQVLLKDYATFKIGGPADYFVEVGSVEEVAEAVAWAKEHGQKIFALGGGSNLLVSDLGFRGLVIKLGLKRLDFDGQKVVVGAGVFLAYLLNQALDSELTGLEFLAGIPGTVGGAVRGNAGTYGLAMDSVIRQVNYLDENFNLQSMVTSQAEFSYRHSIFKTKPYIILEVELELKSGDVSGARTLVAERLKYRKDTQPNEPSAGCIFKNIRFEDVNIDDLKARGIEIDKFTQHRKIPAAYIIEKTGLKGYAIGDAQVSEKHSNYIINKGQAKSDEVVMLISYIKQQVRDKYGLQLQEEVQLLV